MTTTKTFLYDGSRHIDTPEHEAYMLADALESGDARLIAHTIGLIARARGMTQIARQAGIKREALYRALSEDGNPSLDTLINVTRALGLTLTAKQREVAE